jgi:hypothetical protein
MVPPVKQANLPCDPLGVFQFGADVCTEKQFLLFINGRRAAEDERSLRFFCVSVRPVFFFLGIYGYRVRPTIKIKLICYVDCEFLSRAVLLSKCRRNIPMPQSACLEPM